MNRVQGKNIIITGASSGIGSHIARKVAANGGNPILVARSLEKLQALAEEVNKVYDVSCVWYCADLTNLTEWKSVLKTILSDHGRIHALVNNAGFGFFELVEDSKWEDTERMFRLNVFAVIQGIYEILPHFIENAEGHIVNIASQAGKIATPKSAVYAATKHAVIGFTNALRLETEDHGIYVTSVNLGPVRTNFFEAADPTGHYQRAVDRYMLDPAKVADRVTNALFSKKREINMPVWMDIGSRLYQVLPSLMERALKRQFHKK
ncbi:SDR family oxidoreductase [Aquibacillus sp. 3ASR75-11]|uniref:SDR family oxidoreductase n=1 Tax=Terrihalobacillus insolitus TaxID=2950438 RepID=A0A9X3WXU5_9BACI|nr:SDR family oxidoreductase [Terrihalobacillus insolitus]MDC3414474.1 SDR family oxidoreductase [Terrihalobacillus insolitus]MDC3425354.1 SDR family oxidoreductase [Terrihalobacillus insolitus]